MGEQSVIWSKRREKLPDVQKAVYKTPQGIFHRVKMNMSAFQASPPEYSYPWPLPARHLPLQRLAFYPERCSLIQLSIQDLHKSVERLRWLRAVIQRREQTMGLSFQMFFRRVLCAHHQYSARIYTDTSLSLRSVVASLSCDQHFKVHDWS